MTGSEEILQFGPNAYAKPATALNILRETILGRELFDFAFREYARRWKFKRPTPSDFFRTMEDASGVDLDWFWRGWFYSTDHVDIAIDSVRLYQIDSGDPDERSRAQAQGSGPIKSRLSRNNAMPNSRSDIDWQPGLKDYYNSPDYDEFAVEESARKAFQKMLDGARRQRAGFAAADHQLLCRSLQEPRWTGDADHRSSPLRRQHATSWSRFLLTFGEPTASRSTNCSFPTRRSSRLELDPLSRNRRYRGLQQSLASQAGSQSLPTVQGQEVGKRDAEGQRDRGQGVGFAKEGDGPSKLRMADPSGADDGDKSIGKEKAEAANGSAGNS